VNTIAATTPGPTPADRAVAAWLFVCAAMIVVMIVVGGITRLTESGLSITEWRPVTGAIPPLSEARWQEQFDLYKKIPEYRQLNAGMSLLEFKSIFWWEFGHRLWGRLIGIVFAVPMLWFLWRGKVRRALRPHLFVILALGGLQGALGWYMVASGLVDRTDVSQYRLVAHLLAALLVYGYILWAAFGLIRPAATPGEDAALARARWRLRLLFVLVLAALTFGGFVAGLNGGLIYNDFPFMNGRLVPDDLLALTPAWLNVFETPGTAQFVHRWLAYATVAAALLAWSARRGGDLPGAPGQAVRLAGIVALAQAALGIATLMLVVPIPLAAAHQAGAVVLFTVVLWGLHECRPKRLSATA
jgi:cytochrome c oxidase assembly protein subunit 15